MKGGNSFRLDRVLVLVLIAICIFAALGNWLVGRRPQVNMATGGAGEAEVALIEIYGTITDAGNTIPVGNAVTSNANFIIKAIRQAREDGIRAMLLHINSPGGTVAASQAIYNELMRTRDETDMKIVASFGDVAASGGYYVASAAHHIMANPGSLTGSIGVIVRTQDVSSLLDKIGVDVNNIKSGEYKDILSPFRQVSPEERDILQQIVETSYEQFLNVVATGRGIDLEQLRAIADGRIYTGQQALDVNLVDSLGNTYDALDKAAELAGIEGEPTLRNYTTPSFREAFNIFFTSQFQQLIPGYEEIQALQWNKIPLALWD